MILVEAKVMDSTHLELSKPIMTRQGVTVMVSVAESGERDAERGQWFAASSSVLGKAYGDSEPDYSESMVRERNPGYGS
jgi:hypothetical protein